MTQINNNIIKDRRNKKNTFFVKFNTITEKYFNALLFAQPNEILDEKENSTIKRKIEVAKSTFKQNLKQLVHDDSIVPYGVQQKDVYVDPYTKNFEKADFNPNFMAWLSAAKYHITEVAKPYATIKPSEPSPPPRAQQLQRPPSPPSSSEPSPPPRAQPPRPPPQPPRAQPTIPSIALPTLSRPSSATSSPAALDGTRASSLSSVQPDPRESGLKRYHSVSKLEGNEPKMLGALFSQIHNRPINTYNANLEYADFMNIWEPQNTYEAIIQIENNQVSRLLHHLRVCLEILHLIYFRLDPELKEYLYVDLLKRQSLKQTEDYEHMVPLIIYAGWDMTKVTAKGFESPSKSTDMIPSIKSIPSHAVKLLHIPWGIKFYTNTEKNGKYEEYYKYIDAAFGSLDLASNKVDTLVEILCLIFGVNYKKYVHKNNLDISDRYHDDNLPTTISNAFTQLKIGGMKRQPHIVPIPPTGPGNIRPTQNASQIQKQFLLERESPVSKPPKPLKVSRNPQTPVKLQEGPNTVTIVRPHYAITSQDKVTYLRGVYEKHCILIVATLLMLGVTSFQVPLPPKHIMDG
jgi:hypothetical protein